MKVCMLLAVVAVMVAMAAAQGGDGRRPPPGGPGGRRPPPGGPGGPGGRRPPHGGRPDGEGHGPRPDGEGHGPPPCIEFMCGEDTECPRCIGDIIHSSEDSTLKEQLHQCYTDADDCADEATVDQTALSSCIEAINADIVACFPAK
ncbi:H/ACA ribonucleoprotein complex non-core subunit NAF1-like [Penaeus monodon]|uniref:H/ACA ribonucleoprotein complex non-core subunit NAF1-like n=1 Tax=Penaeus monodon TaxID=6687 RepID=UPI0018A75B80|nr:H/ACA ribonucleoprotein complex non-core subunit NAF1-like [Penaeus monodon]